MEPEPSHCTASIETSRLHLLTVLASRAAGLLAMCPTLRVSGCSCIGAAAAAAPAADAPATTCKVMVLYSSRLGLDLVASSIFSWGENL